MLLEVVTWKCYNGHVRTDVLGMHAETYTECAACFGHLQVLQWASLNGGIFTKEALLYAITADQIEVLEWLVLNGGVSWDHVPACVENALAVHENPEIKDWANNNLFKFSRCK
jgi:hypothetical protein